MKGGLGGVLSIALLAGCLLCPWTSFAQNAQGVAAPNLTTGDPPAPIAPAVISRAPDGRATVRASRISEALRIDGRLDERAYREVAFITDFIQQEPAGSVPLS